MSTLNRLSRTTSQPPLVTAILIYSIHVKHVAPPTDIRATLRSLDLFGMGSLITWLTLLIVSLNMGGDSYAWNSPVIIGLLAGTGASFVAFVAAENYATNPVVPMGLFVRWASRNVPIMTGGAPSCCTCLAAMN